MSRFYEMRPQEVALFLQTHKIMYKEQNSNFTLRYCPLCLKPHNNEYSNMYTMGIQSATGVYHCFRCGAKGNWFQFKDHIMQRFYGTSLGELVGGVNPSSVNGGEQGFFEDRVTAKYDVMQAFNTYL
jgi:hypothetical protein